MKDRVGFEISKTIRIFAERLGCEVVELNVQEDHVHLLVMVPPKVSISQLVGTIKGKSAIQIFKQFPYLKKKPYWGNHFWAKGYCVDTCRNDTKICKVSRENRKGLRVLN